MSTEHGTEDTRALDRPDDRPDDRRDDRRDRPDAGDAAALRAELLRRRLAGGGPAAPRRDTIARADRDGPLPLSHGQEQMWFLDRLEPGSGEYLVPLVLRLRGPLDVAALERAWQGVLDRHEILRTRYALRGDTPVQLIDPPRPHPLEHAAAGDDDAVRELVEAELGRAFDLARDRPVRGLLIRLGAEEHVLAVVFHHIACDAWSTQVFGRELSALYGGAAPAPLTVQYADFAAWQRERAGGAVIERHLGYWTGRLAGLAPLDLPADRPRPAVRDGAGDAVPFTVPPALADRLRALATDRDCTPFMLFLAAFQTLLSRWTGRDDLAVGTVVSGRGRPELQQVIGYGINSLVMRGDLSGDPAFTELLARTRATVLDAYDHQDVPFARIVEALAPERDLSRTPLFQVAFTLHGDRGAAFALPGVDAEPFAGSGRVAKFDLDLQLREGADGALGGHLEYATALFDRATVERLRGHLLRLLDSVAADPGAPLSALEILDAPELALVTGPAPRPVRVTRRVHERFAEQAARTPDAVAVTFGDTHLTYAALDARANRIAHALIARGAGPETLVGLALDRGPELIPALLGILKSGAGYLPLDPANPADRLAYIVRDARAPLVVTTRAHAPLFDGVIEGAGSETGTLLLDDPAEAAALAARPATAPDAPGSPEHLIYTIYTSGSTGRPKGVALTHANVSRLMDRGHEHFAFTASDVWTLFHSYAFDFSVWEMWGALLYGGRLVVVPDAVVRAPEEFAALLARERVTVLNQTPTAFRALTATAPEGLALRAVVFGGERLDPADLRPWTDRFGPERTALVNMYGITETTVHTTFHRISAADLAAPHTSPVGAPLPDLGICLLDGHGRPVPLGVPGEICVAGAGLARGYLHRPGLTAERFVPNPYGPPGSRLYRSGDLARRRPHGSLEFLGRIDDQVKIRGFRIEPGEIAATLAAHPAVRDAVVQVREDTPGDPRLVAYVTPADGTDPEPGALRAHTAARLPSYMVPAAVVVLPALPLTTNGKLDKGALPAPDRAALGTDTFVAPRTVAEERIAAVWAEVLGVERVGVEDGFFDLGGHSIRAVAVVGRLRAAGYDLTVRDVFEHRTVARIAELVTGRPAPTDPGRAVAPFALLGAEDTARLPAGLADAYPLSQVQLGMVVEMLTDDGRHPYHNATAFRIRDERPFSAAALRAAAAAVTARHDVLRTSFALTGYSVPMQLVHAEAEMGVGVTDLSHLPESELLAELTAFVARERAALFDLAAPPLLRLHAHVAGDGSWWLTNTECHPILDGWSHHSLLMEILREYETARDDDGGGDPAPAQIPARTPAQMPAQAPNRAQAPAGGPRFADFIAAERDALGSAGARAHWQKVVDDHARLSVPAAWRGDPDAEGAPHRVAVPFHDLEDRLRALATRAGASLKSVLHAAHLKTLGMCTEEERFFTGLVCNARPEVLGADRVHGMHLNTLPFPHDRTAATWRDLVAQVFAREVALWPYRAFPMPVIQRELADGERLVEMRFSYHDFDQVDHDRVDYLASIDDSPTEFSLGVSARIGHLVLTASPRLLSRAGTDRLAAMLRRVVEAMAADPDGDARAALLPAGERERQLTEWNDTARAENTTDVLTRFEERAARTPDAVAVRHAGRATTYGDLDARADQLAHHLGRLGVGAETRVLVALERGPELVTALLAVWKAGGAYVPVEPGTPAARVAAIAATAGAAVTLTELPDLTGLPATRPARTDDPDRLAYVIFTSGSTGTPKGVEITHRGLTNHVAWAARELASRGPGGAPLFSSVAFDLVVPNLWAPLVTGRPVHTVGHDLDLADLGSALTAGAPYSFVKLTPGHLDVLSRQLTASEARELAPVLVVAGEAFTGAALERWRALAPDTELINEYGPTETSVGATIHPVTEPAAGDEVIPIGRPLPNTRTYVLDHALHPVPVGVPGELYIGGTGVARGYAGRPDLTADRFLPDPYGTAPGARLYRTGDLVRHRPDGAIEFLGRIDDQVKIRGHRIEPGEIQAVLTGHPAVAQAYVTVHEGELAAYYAPATAEPAAVRAHLAERLPDYLVPAALVPLDALPLNANGKVDRRALPAPGPAPETVAATAPRTPAEERIARVWAQVLGRERIGVEDDFFEIGGHSIRAVALVGGLRAGGFDVGVRDVFEHRTVAGLAEHLTGRPARTEVDTPVARFALIAPEDRAALPADAVDAYPLTQVQLGMVLEMMADGTQHAYHNVSSFRITEAEPFAADALRAAVRTVTGRHEMLRTSFHLEGHAQPLQVVHADAAIPVAVADLRGLDEEGRRRAVAEFLAAERADLFDLERAPLLRMTAHVEDDGWRLGLTVCHAITEGWSHRALLMELLDEYRRIRDGAEPSGAPLPAVRYADFVAAELASLDSPRDRAHWRAVTDGHARFALPAAWAGDRGAPRERYRVAVELKPYEAGLRALAARTRVPLKSVLLAAHLTALSLLTEERRFHSGLVFSARPEAPGADRVYGMYLNTLPFAFDAGRERSRAELVREVFAHEAGMWEYRRHPMPAIQHAAGVPRLLDVRFSYQDFDHVDAGRVDLADSAGEAATEFDLAVSAVAGYLVLTTHTHALSRPDADRLTALYAAVLEAMAGDPDGDARAVPLPEPGFPAAGATPPEEATAPSVLRRFEERAALAPDAPAVTLGERTVTYAQLDAHAERLAGALRARGVGAEARVAVQLDRGPELIAALLAVWKAGGAYVPVDPSYPARRVAAILAASGARVALTAPQYADRYPGVEVLTPDAAPARPATPPERGPERGPDLDPDRLAYVIFTSGSTGTPKGVEITHRGLTNHIAWAARELAGRGTGGAPLFSSVAFDLVVPNLWAPLVTGQRVFTVAQDTGPGELGRALTAGAPYSFVKLTPGHLQLLSEQMTSEQAEKLAAVMVVAGEALPGTAADRSLDILGPGRLINEYGPTETSVGATIHPVTEPSGEEVVPIGRPLPGMRTHVLDHALRPVPVGVPGELYVGGTGVARGYAGRPDLTADRFLPDPWGPPGTRMYRTGDLVRHRSDGAVEFLGRIDDQVKIRGHRVELGEVQAVLSGHPAVREAFVTVHEPVPGDRRLVAYWTADGTGTAGPDELAAYCAERLPAYMVPAASVALAAMPLNANGKVDRRALPVPDRGALRTGTEHRPPGTPTERALAAIWSDVLGVAEIGVHDSFFGLGGHSLLMIKVLAAARADGLPVSIYRMYQHDTLSELAAAVDEDIRAARPEPESESAPAPAPAPESAPSGTVQVPAELLARLLGQASGNDPAAVAQAAALIGTAPAGTAVEGLASVMADHNVPGTALAVLRNGEITAVEGHGVLRAGGAEPVTGRTLFQVGSLSKHVTALITLRLAHEGVLGLDDDIARHLMSWHLADDPAAPGPVTVRQLLGHRAGLARHRSVGFRPGEPLPSLRDLLTGRPPVSSAPVRRELVPGEVFRKSSTHYWVLQQVLEDATGEPFEALARRTVLDPLGLADSGFDQDRPLTAGLPVALGHDAHGDPLEGGWRRRAHLAAAGLWTTAADAARFTVAVRRALLGAPDALVPEALARELLAGETGTFYGLGTIVDDSGDDLEFGHGGEPSGYWTMAISRLHGGTGFVALTNADSGKAVVKHLTAELGRDDGAFGTGRLAGGWRAAGGPDAPGSGGALPEVLAPVVTDEDRAAGSRSAGEPR
ncbi:amino acid adenylation domain-containing protein [Streptomyces sp. NPDC093252]|uniref:non-ribosomal peptide synthetase n=1 Tax=Streptomyces sp. NPDC093252 TaxID=3154980 RepID=UPI00343854A8